MKVVTYFSVVPGLWPEDTQWALIELWKQSWAKQGWEPLILQEHHVKLHPRFEFFNEHFKQKPTRFGEIYTVSCFMRWFAASIFDEPLMLCDYDVMNYSFKPRAPAVGRMEIICDGPQVFMGTVLGNPQHFLDMAELYAAWQPDHYDWNTEAGQHHLDDLRLLERMFDGTKERPEWLIRSPGCVLFPNEGWGSSPMTHYAYAMRKFGYWPKHKFIPQLRTF